MGGRGRIPFGTDEGSTQNDRRVKIALSRDRVAGGGDVIGGVLELARKTPELRFCLGSRVARGSASREEQSRDRERTEIVGRRKI